jgi:hypothetical protein
MGKRQIRYLPTVLLARAAEILGREADVVMRNGVVWHGVVDAISATALTLTDLRQLRREVAVGEVAEVLTDSASN